MSHHPAGGVGLDPNVPAPPPGPGAAPPFAAPPTDRNKRGLWIGLIAGGLALVLCCVGGVFGIAVLAAIFANQGSYFTAETFMDGLTPAVWVGAGVVAVGAVVALLIPRTAGQAAAAAQGDWAQGAQQGGGEWSGVPSDAPIAGDA